MPVEIEFCDVCGELTCEDQQACDDERARRSGAELFEPGSADPNTMERRAAIKPYTMERRVFTFGFGQTDPRTGDSLARRYVWVEGRDVEHCIEQMLERFGNREHGGNWAFDYPSAEAAGVDRYKLIEIDFDTGVDLDKAPPPGGE